MRRFWTAALALLSALALLVVGSPAANAFGSEVLGCSFDGGTWTANTCDGGGDGAYHNITFAAHNLSGTYTTSWTVTFGTTVLSTNCNGATTCTIRVKGSSIEGRDRTYWANLKLTQAGQTRTISASALVYGGPDCIVCG
ncbi:hypothetical protein [Jatrophihabitans sp.]|uniref:hypothetical protein n=1 Tax=Jatrophihabitans sp. TaxID=1932789 RepID=UPI002C41DC29|nr:hypothetical protein [Jatrophihabitans sp.]